MRLCRNVLPLSTDDADFRVHCFHNTVSSERYKGYDFMIRTRLTRLECDLVEQILINGINVPETDHSFCEL